jgi:hypothetical protein
MFQSKTNKEFQCEYCLITFSKRGSLRNHLRKHRDQMYLEEAGLSREENVITTKPLQISENNEQDLMLNDDYWKVKKHQNFATTN